ncbi:MAG: M24 family metallopeptidase [Candidatus Thermoplasmatota archaeon]|nr:M24 family metallopeptidase [Candidatus Thermoplasmatota archaeon]
MDSKVLEKVRDQLRENEVFVSVKSGNIRYLSYKELKDPVASAIMIDKEKEIAVVSSLEKNRASDLLDMDIKVFSPYPKIKKDGTKLLSLLKKECYGREIISDARIDGMRTKIKDPVAPLRMIKNSEEIRLIKKANKMTKDVELGAIATEGKSEIAIAREVEEDMLKNGADGFAFDTIVACGKHAAYSHHEPGRTGFKNVAIIDYGARYRGYCADVTRTIIDGSERLGEIKRRIEEAVESAVEKFSEGSKCSEIDRELRGALGKFSKFFYHGTGHGLGLEVHEQPSISITSKDVLEKGMVFTIEPGIYIKGLGGVRVEDDFYVDGKVRKI